VHLEPATALGRDNSHAAPAHNLDRPVEASAINHDHLDASLYAHHSIKRLID